MSIEYTANIDANKLSFNIYEFKEQIMGLNKKIINKMFHIRGRINFFKVINTYVQHIALIRHIVQDSINNPISGAPIKIPKLINNPKINVNKTG